MKNCTKPCGHSSCDPIAFSEKDELRKLEVKHLPSDYPRDHYEIVWQEGRPTTKVEDNILLK